LQNLERLTLSKTAPPGFDMAISRFVLIVYRLPTKPTAARVAVWRQLKKVGAVYLQQSVCVFPDVSNIRRALIPILQKIESSSGSFYLLPLRSLPAAEIQKLVAEFKDQAAKQYQEIVENCEVNFQKEIEFETFRGNFTYEEAEEIRIEYDKIVKWFDAVRDRDWFGASNQTDAEQWLVRCEALLEEFEERVFRAQAEPDGERPSSQRPRRAAARMATPSVPHKNAK
jgi:hypothetical protein